VPCGGCPSQRSLGAVRSPSEPQRPEPAPVEDLMGASHDLHVRLRHPLLPQPHGFDGLARQGASHGGVVGLLNENWPRRNPVRL
jgi:hypothetical protein